MKPLMWKLDKIGRVRLSEHFYMRQFLYSEIAAAFGIVNIPDNEALAIETGTQLCQQILEPLVTKFGPIVIRSGFRSEKLNEYGHKHRMHCGTNESNYAYHIWDRLDTNGKKGAAACIVIPSFNDGKTEMKTQQDLANYLNDHVPYHQVTFFSRNNAFNIGWHEKPIKTIYSLKPKPHFISKG